MSAATGGPGGPGLWVPCGQEEMGREAFRRGSSRPSGAGGWGGSARPRLRGSARGPGRPLLALRRAVSGVWRGLKTDGESQERVGGWQAETLRAPTLPGRCVRRERQGAEAGDIHSRPENRFALPVFVFALETHAGTQREALGEKGRPETCYKGHVDKAQSPDHTAGGRGAAGVTAGLGKAH